MRTIQLDRLDLSDGMKLLDLGCGTGRHLHAAYFAADMVCIGIDLSLEDLIKARDLVIADRRMGLALVMLCDYHLPIILFIGLFVPKFWSIYLILMLLWTR